MRHQLRPLFDRVVIKELDPDRIRRSGLLVPPGSDEPPPQHGIVLAVGPGLDWWDHVGVQMPVKRGDHVVFPASAGAWVESSARPACSAAAASASFANAAGIPNAGTSIHCEFDKKYSSSGLNGAASILNEIICFLLDAARSTSRPT